MEQGVTFQDGGKGAREEHKHCLLGHLSNQMNRIQSILPITTQELLKANSAVLHLDKKG